MLENSTILCKYCPIDEYSLANLKENCIYFSDPREFEDTLDCRNAFSVSKQSLHNLFDLILSRKSDYDKYLFLKVLCSELNKREISDLLENIKGALDPYLYNSLLKDNSSSEKIRMLFNGYKVEKIKDILEESRLAYLEKQKIGVSCFSRRIDNDYLWKKYAINYTGFCIEFNSKIFPSSKQHPVIYDVIDPVIDLGLFNRDPAEAMSKLFAYKLKYFEPEEEIRIFHNKSKTTYRYDISIINKIVIGENIDPKSYGIISEYCDEIGLTNLFKASKHGNFTTINKINL